jgi:hypothetical protein
MRVPVAALCVALTAGCTAVNTARLPQGTAGAGDVFVTTGDIKEPYASLGVIQATRKGAVIFGWGDPGGTDLDDALKDLVAEARVMGGDGVINLRFQQTQYPPWARTCGLIFFIVPLPAEVTLTGEVVRLGDGGGSDVKGGRP